MNQRLPMWPALHHFVGGNSVRPRHRVGGSEINYTLPPRSQIKQLIIERPQTAPLQLDCTIGVCT